LVSACPLAALWIVKTLGQSATPNVVTASPNYAAWKLVKKFSVSDASRLWCDIEPGAVVTRTLIVLDGFYGGSIF